MGDFDEVIDDFLQESREGLDQLDQDLVALEQSPRDKELLGRIFRCAHTIKGTAGFLGYTKLEAVTHAGETILSRLRDGALTPTPNIATHLFTMVDAIRRMLDHVQKSGSDGDMTYAELIDALMAAAGAGTAPPNPPPVLSVKPAPVTEVHAAPARTSAPPSTKSAPPEVRAIIPSRPAPVRSIRPHESQALARESSRPIPATPPPPPSREIAILAAAVETAHEVRAIESVRVDVTLLNKLMDLAGELVLSRNQILQLHSALGDPTLAGASQRLNFVTLGLQEGIMRMRMQPIDGLLSKFPRVVRDIARDCKKLVSLEVEAKNTNLDRTLIEAVKDPLTHILRNAIDHGIETPQRRNQLGKHPEGRILIRAIHQSGQVHIEIIDDGAGIDASRVRKKALEKGLISSARAAQLSDGELVNLIFLPGFSTAETVTNVSGRGVGMDVVKTNVERVGGAVEIETVVGRGTTFRLRVPLTLAIVPALIVSVGVARYAVPQVALRELVLVDTDRTRQRIEQVKGAPVYRLRDKLLPLVFLSEQLGHCSRAECYQRRKGHILILQAGGRQFGLVVDQVLDQQEIVVKPLVRALKQINVFAGATILGDGRVVLILDVLGIAQRGSLDTEARDEHLAELPSTTPERTLRSILLVRGADDARIAIALERVERLETCSPERIEEAGGREVAQYDREIVPVLRLAQLLPERRSRARYEDPVPSSSNVLNLVVVRVHGQRVVLVVGEVIDVIDVPLHQGAPPPREGITETLVVDGRIAEVLDVDRVVLATGLVSPSLREAV